MLFFWILGLNMNLKTHSLTDFQYYVAELGRATLAMPAAEKVLNFFENLSARTLSIYFIYLMCIKRIMWHSQVGN